MSFNQPGLKLIGKYLSNIKVKEFLMRYNICFNNRFTIPLESDYGKSRQFLICLRVLFPMNNYYIYFSRNEVIVPSVQPQNILFWRGLYCRLKCLISMLWSSNIYLSSKVAWRD